MSSAQNPDASRAPRAVLDGRVYEHFQTSVPVTTAVYGEFPWIATVGDAARMRDFIAPPYLLSQEITAAETVWSAGEYVEPEEIWTAFALPGAPPPKHGVGPAQPNPWGSQLVGVWAIFGLGAAACFGVYLWLAAATGFPKESYRGEFDVSSSDVERSRVTEVFELPGGRATNVEVLLDSNVDQQWAYVSLALIDADTDQALDFGKELSYYHGVDGGESWSEGSRYATVQVPAVPPGRYYLRVEPETDSPRLGLRVAVKRGTPLLRWPFICTLLMLVPALFAGIRSSVFETSRWMESDHPRVSEDWEDE